MMYDFDTPVDRTGTNTFKWDNMKYVFGRNDLLPFWVADMDFPVPKEITAAIKERTDHPLFGYTYIPDSAYDAVIGWCGERHGWEIDRARISFSTGVMPSIAFAVQAFTRRGDKIIIQPPVYHPFFSVVTDNERELVENPLVQDGKGYYEINFTQLEQQMRDGAKMIIFCSPHNPVGRVWKREELLELGRLCEKYDVLIISDEIHADLTLYGNNHIPFGTLPDPYEKRVLVCRAPSKTFNIPGLTISEVIIPDRALQKQYTDYKRRFHGGIKNLLSVIALENAYKYGEAWLADVLSYIERNIAFMDRFLREQVPQVRFRKPEGTFLGWLDFRHIDESGYGPSLMEKGKIGLSEGAHFGDPGIGFQRINLACSRSLLEDGLGRIAAAVND